MAKTENYTEDGIKLANATLGSPIRRGAACSKCLGAVFTRGTNEKWIRDVVHLLSDKDGQVKTGGLRQTERLSKLEFLILLLLTKAHSPVRSSRCLAQLPISQNEDAERPWMIKRQVGSSSWSSQASKDVLVETTVVDSANLAHNESIHSRAVAVAKVIRK